MGSGWSAKISKIGEMIWRFFKVDPVVTSEFCVHWGKYLKTGTF